MSERDITILKEMLAAGPGCAIANGLLNGFETTKVKLQLNNSTQQRHQHPHQPLHQNHLHQYSSSSRAMNNVATTAANQHPRNLHVHAVARLVPVTTGGGTASAVYPNATMTGVMSQIAREEGIIRGLLTPGLSASVTRSLLYGAYRVGLYPTVRDSVGRSMGNTHTSNASSLIQQRILSGMITGGLGSMISCPLDVIRTRMQADAGLIVAKAQSCTNPLIPQQYYATGLRKGQAVRYTGMFSAFITIWKEEGLVNGLYRGASVTIARACVLNGSQLASYDTMKHYTLNWANDHHLTGRSRVLFQEGPLLHVLCAFVSGVLAQTVIMPIDTIKSHMMLGKGWKDVLKHGGSLLFSDRAKIGVHPVKLLSWLYRGYAPACAGQGMIMVLQMPLIEAFRSSLGCSAI